jgi:DNA replication and repair protein RecF
MSGPPTGPDKGGLRRLVLSEFRSYPALDIAIEADTIVVSGENGSGKTNLLEAISMFAQGRGLRRADLAACARRPGSGGFAVSLELATQQGTVQFGTGLEASDAGSVRRHRVDREPVGSARAFADRLRLVWLTPAMDSLFNGSPGDRRRFLDRLVLAVDAEHGARVVGMERAMRQRNRILEEGSRADAVWLDAVEREVAELAVAVAAGRTETITRLATLIGTRQAGAVPWARIALAGDVEALCVEMAAIDVEDRYRTMLKASRAQDAAAGRTLSGPHVTDLVVRHGPKDIEASLCSTGEQKALLVGLVLAHARLVADLSGLAPVVLLDEIAAHFDLRRREALFDELDALPGQIWMTGAEAQAFAPIAARAQNLRVKPGSIETV